MAFARPILASENVGACDDHWSELARQYEAQEPPDYPGFLDAWQALKGECSKSPRYKARLGLINFYLHRGKEAQAAVAGIDPAEVDSEPLVQLVQLLADAAVMRYSGKPKEEELLSLEQRMREFMKRNPYDVLGVTLLADIFSQLGRYPPSIEAYERVLEFAGMSAKSAQVMRNLMLNYVAVGRYEDAARLAAPAATHKRSLMSDLYFACGAATAYAEIGKIDTAKDVLNILVNRRPEVTKAPEFIAAVDLVRRKIKESER